MVDSRAPRLLLAAAAFGVISMVAIHAAPVLASAAPGAQQPASPAAAKTIDINQAGEEELTVIPGIGPAMAKRIVDFRQQNGPFRQVEDLMKVKGIGEKSLEKLRPYVKIGKGS